MHDSSSVAAIVFLNGSTLATGGEQEGYVKLWDPRTCELLKVLKGHSRNVVSIAVSADETTLATAAQFEKGIKLWDVATAKEKRVLTDDAFANVVAFPPDGKTLASADSDKSVKLWATTSDELKQKMMGHDYEVVCVAFSPNGRTVASSSDKTVRLWDSRSGRLLVTFMILPAIAEGTASTEWIAFTPEGYYTGSAGAARFIRWRVKDRLFPAKRYERTYHRPDLVRKRLAFGM